MTRIDPVQVSKIIQEVADEHILPRFRNLGEGDIAFKIGDDPVTIADKEAEKALSTRLSDLLPGSKVLGEEAFSSDSRILDLLFGESPVWIVDPVDGTRNFVRGSSEFGVIVSLSQRNQIIAGWIYDPTSKEVVTAEKGAGSWYKNQSLKVKSAAKLPEMHGFLGDRLLEHMNKSSDSIKIKPVLNVMSAGAHEYPRLVVNGPHFGKDLPQIHYRASYQYTTPWDDAAGILIHQEAGGYSAYWNGEAYKPSEMNRGIALTPDRDSWNEFRAWCQSFCALPV
ncbi:MAG TPA: inositol monophosphatase family protein [Alphaproteobacteria bacterium]|nr:inositol monophosphatase family protein [Alphaproteobacteria bacterium]